MKALTVAQPFPLKFEVGSLVENRNWLPPENIIGQYIALHGGKSKSFSKIEDNLEFILRYIFEAEMPVWLSDQIDWHNEHDDDAIFARDIQLEGIFAVAKLERVVTSQTELPSDQAYWFFGRYGWVFSDYTSFAHPIPCGGQLGLWNLEDIVIQEVKEKFKLAKSRV